MRSHKRNFDVRIGVFNRFGQADVAGESRRAGEQDQQLVVLAGTDSLFRRDVVGRGVKQARAQLESAKINYDDSVQQVELEVQQSYANLRAAREVIRSQQKNVEQALEALRLSNERFSAGAGTQLDVLDARTSLTQARTTEIRRSLQLAADQQELDRKRQQRSEKQQLAQVSAAGDEK